MAYDKKETMKILCFLNSILFSVNKVFLETRQWLDEKRLHALDIDDDNIIILESNLKYILSNTFSS